MMRFKTLLGVSAIAGFAALAPSIGFAAQCQFGDEASFGILEADVFNSTDCIGAQEGNDSNSDLDGFFDVAEWTEDTKFDSDANSYNPEGILTVDFTGGSMMEGTWEVSSWDGIAKAMIVVKAGNFFAAYLIDTTAGLTGGWSTRAIEVGWNGNQPDVSHISLFVCSEDDEDCGGGGTGGDVPLPGGLPLLASAAGIGYILRRRKR